MEAGRGVDVIVGAIVGPAVGVEVRLGVERGVRVEMIPLERVGVAGWKTASSGGLIRYLMLDCKLSNRGKTREYTGGRKKMPIPNKITIGTIHFRLKRFCMGGLYCPPKAM